MIRGNWEITGLQPSVLNAQVGYTAKTAEYMAASDLIVRAVVSDLKIRESDAPPHLGRIRTPLMLNTRPEALTSGEMLERAIGAYLRKFGTKTETSYQMIPITREIAQRTGKAGDANVILFPLGHAPEPPPGEPAPRPVRGTDGGVIRRRSVGISLRIRRGSGHPKSAAAARTPRQDAACEP